MLGLWKIEEGGAVGGRILILAANGTRDALRSTDGKSTTGSSSPRLSSSWKETESEEELEQMYD